MTARACIVCGGDFTPRPGCERTQTMCSDVCRVKQRRERERANHQPVRRPCLRCGVLMPPRDRYTGNRRFCSEECRLGVLTAPVVTSADAVPCQHCGTPFERKAAGRLQRYCQPACRVAAFKARHAEDDGAEIPVVGIDEAPRRLALAKMLDRYDGTGFFDHGATGPTWINPADKRASR
ncbi:putative nucleic acid-binding Zn ribbon protein [Bradyrhizobium sp. AZCC 1578]